MLAILKVVIFLNFWKQNVPFGNVLVLAYVWLSVEFEYDPTFLAEKIKKLLLSGFA